MGRIFPTLLNHISGFTKDDIKSRYIDNPNYKNEEDNLLRLKLLWAYSGSLLLSLLNAKWVEEELNESEFKNLRLIYERRWNLISNFTGDLSVVANRVGERGIWYLDPMGQTGGVVDAIHNIERNFKFDKLDRNLILLQSDDSRFTTILEGNKTALAFYIKCFLKKELPYKSFRVYFGHLKNKCKWQW